MKPNAGSPRVLIVDDEPDVHSVTKLSLRGLKHAGKAVEFASAASGKEAVEDLRTRPETAVVLLDVVMETSSAGLDACRAIRGELCNKLVRILLRTGQPGIAPERKAIDEYDIDGYLPKAELSTNRLYAAIRTGLKAHDELVELERHRRILTLVHDSVVSLHSFEALETALQRVLSTAVAIAPVPLAVLNLQTFEEQGNPRNCLLHLATGTESNIAQASAEQIVAAVAADPAARALREAGEFKSADGRSGYLVPLSLHRDLGYGWIYLAGSIEDALTRRALSLLAAHASNALYSAVAQALLSKGQAPFYDSLIV